MTKSKLAPVTPSRLSDLVASAQLMEAIFDAREAATVPKPASVPTKVASPKKVSADDVLRVKSARQSQHYALKAALEGKPKRAIAHIDDALTDYANIASPGTKAATKALKASRRAIETGKDEHAREAAQAHLDAADVFHKRNSIKTAGHHADWGMYHASNHLETE